MRSFKTDIFHDETFVFTPKGDVISLPLGATVIDFAYAIHSAVGNKMVGAKINGVIVPIDRVPNNGEIIEILTSSSSKGPSRDWLKIVKTGQARTKIRQWFKKEKRPENIVLGRSEVEKEVRRLAARSRMRRSTRSWSALRSESEFRMRMTFIIRLASAAFPCNVFFQGSKRKWKKYPPQRIRSRFPLRTRSRTSRSSKIRACSRTAA